ncbi:MAG: right-handed parallel beta-helix repeat-containing protein [Chloroflexota bacterium]
MSGFRRIGLAFMVWMALATTSQRAPAAATAPSRQFLPLLIRPNVTLPTCVEGGQLDQDTTWTAGCIHLTTAIATVPAGLSLTVEAGAMVQFRPATALVVEGHLVANGTAGGRVQFVADQPTAAPGYWQGVQLRPGATADLSYTDIMDGGAYSANLYSDGASLTLDNALVGRSAGYGLYARDTVLTAQASTFSDNASDGLRLLAQGRALSPLLDGNTFLNNGEKALFLRLVNATPGSFTADGNSGSGNGTNGIVLEGTLGNTTLTPNPGLAYVWQSVTVAEGATVMVAAGTVIKADRLYAGGGSLVTVLGTLEARGTAERPVIFTSLQNDADGGDTNGDGGLSLPAPGDWRGVVVQGNGTIVIDYTKIEYGGYSDPGEPGIAQLQVLGGTADLDHLTVRYALLNGVYVEDASLTMRNGAVSDNAGFGLRLHGRTRYLEPIIQDNDFSRNGTYGLYLILNGGGMGNGDVSGNSGRDNGMVNGVYMEGHISDPISQWNTNPDFPWVIWTLYVDAGARLTVAPGNVLKFINPPDGHDGVTFARGTGTALITGTLEAVGTETEPIIFTSYWDDSAGGDTNGDTGGTEVLAGDWRGFIVRPGGRAILTHTEFRYGGGTEGGDTKAIFANGGAVEMSYSQVYSSSWTGVGGTGAITITTSVIRDNTGNGIQFGGPGSVQGSAILNNGVYGLANYYAPYNEYRAMAYNNYWGAEDGPSSDGLACPFALPTGNGAMVSCRVDWQPFLTEPPNGVQ